MNFKIIPRIIVSLLLRDDYFIKTKNFQGETYIGDPINSLRIFNDLEVDEIAIFDLDKSVKKENINFELLKKISSECFMPVTQGGGVKNLEDVQKIFSLGIEKIAFNSLIFENFEIFKNVCNHYGAQSVVASIDIKQTENEFDIYIYNGKIKTNESIEDLFNKFNNLGIGEIIITDIEKDGLRTGYNLDVLKKLSKLTDIPIIINGGAAKNEDFRNAIDNGASAVAASSLFVLNKSFETVLIDYPNFHEKQNIFKK